MGPLPLNIGKIVGSAHVVAVCVVHCVLNVSMDEASADGVHNGCSTN